MNLQGRLINGKWEGGIEWTRIREVTGFLRRGYTWNVIKGCQHGCTWTMPDGAVAVCYAKTTAESPALAAAAYPEGFAHHYFAPQQLNAPFSVRERAGVFMDSMSDFAGSWVPPEQQEQVLHTVERAGRARGHIFFLLTKTAPQLLKLPTLPHNLWPGVSSPPDSMFGHALTELQRERYMARAMDTLTQIRETGPYVPWMSFEPLAHDYSHIVRNYPRALAWAVIGAASNGNTYFDPDEAHVRNLLDVLDEQGVRVFFKGNLRRAAARWGLKWREDFPPVEVPLQETVTAE